MCGAFRFSHYGTWVLKGIADLNLALHVMDDHVHVGHCPGFRDILLSEQFNGSIILLSGGLHFRFPWQVRT